MVLLSQISILLRLLAASILIFFAGSCGWGIWSLGVEVVFGFSQMDGAYLGILLAVMILLGSFTYLFLLLAWRAITGRSSRRDGGLLPPLAVMFCIACVAVLSTWGSIGNYLAGHYLRSALGFFSAVGLIGLFRSYRRRAADAMARNVPM